MTSNRNIPVALLVVGMAACAFSVRHERAACETAYRALLEYGRIRVPIEFTVRSRYGYAPEIVFCGSVIEGERSGESLVFDVNGRIVQLRLEGEGAPCGSWALMRGNATSYAIGSIIEARRVTPKPLQEIPGGIDGLWGRWRFELEGQSVLAHISPTVEGFSVEWDDHDALPRANGTVSGEPIYIGGLSAVLTKYSVAFWAFDGNRVIYCNGEWDRKNRVISGTATTDLQESAFEATKEM